MKTLERLTTITELNKKDNIIEFKNKDLYRLLYDIDIYIAAYQKIKSYEGNVDLDGMSTALIKKMIERIKVEEYQFKPAKRIWIPKPGKKDKRPIDVGSVEDKLLLEGIRMILEAIYEPVFKECSHGFRPNKGCHTALKDIRVVFKGSKWFIEGDIRKFFNSIDHDILMKIMRKRIDDERFLNLIRKVLNAGYYEFKDWKSDLAGTPQGNIISPILSNIFLHEFDVFMEDLKKEFEFGSNKKRRLDSAYVKARGKVEKARAISSGEVKILRRAMLELPASDYRDPKYRRLKYVRYADDWLVGLVGTLADAKVVKDKIKNFLSEKLHIELNEEKTLITNSASGKALFLGTHIQCPIYQEQKFIIRDKLGSKGVKLKQRISSAQIRMEMPMERVIDKLKVGFFCDGGGNPIPKTLWQHYSHKDIILSYNAVINGILNYYSFVDNTTALARINYILRSSAAKLLAMKFRLGTQRKVYQKFSRELEAREPNGKSYKIVVGHDWKRKPMNFSIGTNHNVQAMYITRATNTKLKDSCMICGSDDRVEMHHVKHIRKMNGNLKPQERSMISLNRKQIPVCKGCHTDIHAGRYDGVALKKIVVNKV